MLIVEGPDGGGKTTLAQRLAVEFNLEIRRPPKDVLSSEKGPVDPEQLIYWWLKEIDDCKHDAAYERRGIYDRTTFISDPIYRLLFGEPSGATPAQMGRGISYVANYGFVIFCLPGESESWAALNIDPARENLVKDRQRHDVLYWAYECQYSLWSEIDIDHFVKYDWRNYKTIKEGVMEHAL